MVWIAHLVDQYADRRPDMKAASCLVFALVVFVFTATAFAAESELTAAPLRFAEDALEIESRAVAGEQYDFISLPGLAIDDN